MKCHKQSLRIASVLAVLQAAHRQCCCALSNGDGYYCEMPLGHENIDPIEIRGLHGYFNYDNLSRYWLTGENDRQNTLHTEYMFCIIRCTPEEFVEHIILQKVCPVYRSYLRGRGISYE